MPAAKGTANAATEKKDDEGTTRALASHAKRIGQLEDRVAAIVAKLGATLNIDLSDVDE